MGERDAQPEETPQTQPRDDLPTSRLAVAAFVLALTGVGAPIALVLAAVSLWVVSRPEKRRKGAALAIAGLVICALWALGIAIAVGRPLWPALITYRHVSDRGKCMGALHNIGRAMNAYSEDHNDRLPTTGTPGDSIGSLNLLLQLGYVRDARVFHCPADTEGEPATMSRELSDATCSYFYDNTAPRLDDAPFGGIIMYDESPDFHDGFRSLLLWDGAVQWLPEDEFQELLSKQNRPNAP